MMTLFVLLLLASHASAALPLCWKIRGGRDPGVADFAVLSVMIFYDIGLVCEIMGFPYEHDFLPSLFQASDSTFLLAFIAMLLAPWCFILGACPVIIPEAEGPGVVRSRLKAGRRALFYALAAIVIAPLVVLGAQRILQGEALWAAREAIALDFGPFILLLYIPLHFLAFYVQQEDSRARAGRIFGLLFCVAAILSTLSIGERTNALLPVLILVLFTSRISLRRLAVFGASMLIIATILLPIFKWQFAEGRSRSDLVNCTIGDMSRAGILSSVIDASPPVGTSVLPYPGSGYVYSLLFYVPRAVAPFKGLAAANLFTARVTGTNPDETYWVLGMGVVEEAILNLGFLMVLPVLLVYGLGFGWLDRLSTKLTSMALPSRLAALWICDHHLPAVLLMFGSMGLVCWVLEAVFSEPLYPHRTVHPRRLRTGGRDTDGTLDTARRRANEAPCQGARPLESGVS